MKIAFLGLFLLLAISCSLRDLRLFDPATYFPREKDSLAIPGLPNTSEENVLANLKLSYNRRDEKLYQDIISPDFRFYMSASLVGAINGGLVLPPEPAYWTAEIRTDSGGSPYTVYYKTYDQDLQTIRKMFDPTKTMEIELFFQAFAYDTSRADTSVYNLRNIELTVVLREPYTEFTAKDVGSPEPTRLTLVRGNDGLWKITEWIDNTLGSEDALQ